MEGWSVFIVAMSVRMLSMFYGSVLLTRIVGKNYWLSSGPHKERLLKTSKHIR